MNNQVAKADAVWKCIPEYEGLYEVSDNGEVRAVRRRGTDGRILRQRTDKKGYKYVYLCKECKYKSFLVHRLVAQVFVDNPQKEKCVNHKDEDKSNNTADNLEWCSYQYNNNYGTARKRAAEKRYKPCIGLWPDGTKRRFNSCTIASKETGISQGNIWGACNGLWKKAGGVLWSYE